MSPHDTLHPISNDIFLASSYDFAHLMPKFTEVRLAAHTILDAPDRPIEHAYFPLRGMISLVKPLERWFLGGSRTYRP